MLFLGLEFIGSVGGVSFILLLDREIESIWVCSECGSIGGGQGKDIIVCGENLRSPLRLIDDELVGRKTDFESGVSGGICVVRGSVSECGRQIELCDRSV